MTYEVQAMVRVPVEGASLSGQLTVPTGAGAVVLFAHGASSNHLSERNRFMARVLHQHNFGTLLFDLLTKVEDVDYPNRFNIPLLTDRLLAATATSIRRWQRLSGYLAISGRVRGRPRRCGQRPGCLGVSWPWCRAGRRADWESSSPVSWASRWRWRWLSKKIGHPANHKYAIGVVTLAGAFINENAAEESEEYIREETVRLQVRLRASLRLFIAGQPQTSIKGKTVVVDDGIATGNTMLGAVEAIRSSNPGKLIVAVPVASPHAAQLLQPSVDEFIYLSLPSNFRAVGRYYVEFEQVSDDEVIRLLQESASRML